MTTSRKPSWSRALRALIKTEHGFGWLISEARMESRRYPLNTHHQTGQTSFLEISAKFSEKYIILPESAFASF
jgi:hypothetical protein